MKTLDGIGLTAPKGFKAASIHAGIKKENLDMGLVVADVPCQVAAVYTTNVVQAGCIKVTKAHLENKQAQAIIVNSGNANACTTSSESDALETCQKVAAELGIKVADVVVASTGVIGQPLPMEKIREAIPKLVAKLDTGSDVDNALAAAIMTTDTTLKQAACRMELGDKGVLIAGVAKGSGMIHPNMATMLSFITTDIMITPELLQKALSEVTESTFNSISVDGDTSTNDCLVIMSSGLAGNKLVDHEDEDYETFKQALEEVCLRLAKKIAEDGEGATKLITCRVAGCQTDADAKAISMSVNASALVKTAMTGADANWGRILVAMGYAGVDFDPTVVDVTFKSMIGEVMVCQDGAGLEFDEAQATEILSAKEVLIDIKIKTTGHGASWVTYGCDLTYEYVRINGDYRT